MIRITLVYGFLTNRQHNYQLTAEKCYFVKTGLYFIKNQAKIQ